MTTVRYARVADLMPDGSQAAAPLDLSTAVGDLVSATKLPGGITRVSTRQRNGAFLVRATGHKDLRPGDWGERPADGVYANALMSASASAFIATFDGGHVRSRLQAYYALGVVTLHAFHSFAEGSGRRDYFSREFFTSAVDGSAVTDAGREREFPRALLSGGNDPAGLLGTWECLDPSAGSIGRLECSLADGELVVRAHAMGANGLADWGIARTELYADGLRPDSPPAFLATYDHGFMRMHLQARINRGILVVIEYAEFTDGSGRSDYFIRECYRR